MTPNDCVISTRSLGSVKNFEELEARTRALCERGPVSPEGCAWQNVEIFHNQRRTFKWMELELHSYSLVLSLFPFHLPFTRTSSLGFDTGVTSTFMPRNNIKRRERHTASNKYWLDPSGTGKAVLVYCDMNLEGNSHLTRCSFHCVFELSLFLVASLVALRCKKSHQSWKQCIAQFQLYIKKKKKYPRGKKYKQIDRV